jgi:hypothetical protein
MQSLKDGDIVYMPCRVVAVAHMGLSNEPVADLQPINETTGKTYANIKFTVYAEDLVQREEGK